MNRLTSIPLAAAVAAVLVSPLFAADLPARMPYKAPVPIDAPFSWTGFYIGGHVGGAVATSDWTDTVPGFVGLGDANVHPTGVFGGAQVGANYQIDRIVLGVEGDFSWAGLSNTEGTCFQDITQSCTTRADWFSTVTGRLGVTWDKALFYAKGGVAWAHFKYENPCGSCLSPDYLADETRSGWTAGAGIEYALSYNWSVKLEYDYLDFGTSTPTFFGSVPGDTFTENITNRIHEIKAGLNYRFGWPGAPIVANY